MRGKTDKCLRYLSKQAMDYLSIFAAEIINLTKDEGKKYFCIEFMLHGGALCLSEQGRTAE